MICEVKRTASGFEEGMTNIGMPNIDATTTCAAILPDPLAPLTHLHVAVEATPVQGCVSLSIGQCHVLHFRQEKAGCSRFSDML